MQQQPIVPRVYLAGPMTGLPQLNFPAFHRTAAALRALGYQVHNPAEQENPDDPPLALDLYARRDLNAILDARAIALLDGWEQSRGCSGVRAELAMAAWCRFPIYEAESLIVGVPKLVVVERVNIEVNHG